MASLNKVMLIGNLGQDPEKRVTNTGQSVANFSIATTERWLDKSGQRQEKTEWHRVVVWGPQADNCAQYLSKGRPVYVEGRLQTREWNDKDGNKRYTTEVVAQRVQFLGSPGDKRPATEPAGTTTEVATEVVNQTPDIDTGNFNDVPF